MFIYLKGGKSDKQEKNPGSKGEDQQATLLTYDIDFWNRTWAALVMGEPSFPAMCSIIVLPPHLRPSLPLPFETAVVKGSNFPNVPYCIPCVSPYCCPFSIMALPYFTYYLTYYLSISKDDRVLLSTCRYNPFTFWSQTKDLLRVAVRLRGVTKHQTEIQEKKLLFR